MSFSTAPIAGCRSAGHAIRHHPASRLASSPIPPLLPSLSFRSASPNPLGACDPGAGAPQPSKMAVIGERNCAGRLADRYARRPLRCCSERLTAAESTKMTTKSIEASVGRSISLVSGLSVRRVTDGVGSFGKDCDREHRVSVRQSVLLVLASVAVWALGHLGIWVFASTPAGTWRRNPHPDPGRA